MNQPGFLGAGDDLCLNSSRSLHPGKEFAPVFGFPDGAGARGEDFFHLMRLREPAEAGKRLQAHFHGFRGQGFPLQAPGPQPDHLLFAVDDLERQVGTDPNHDHVNRIRTAVDGRYTHLCGIIES
jgi:hypothetical protein